VDRRAVEAANYFEGKTFGVGDGSLRYPKHWRKLVNPFKPSWGEPYVEIADRMLAAIADARGLARGHEAVIVSHQLPVWTVRSQLEGRHLWHDPRKRQCSLASLTSLTFVGDDLESITYAEPAAALLPGARNTAGA
jgi:broad specificity phosphatase PhoE